MRGLRFTLLLLACAFATGAAAEYPDKPIRLIVPQAAGSATDAVARILGAELAKEIGQQVVVDNRPGGVPRPIVDKLNAAINRAIDSQTFRARFAMIGDEPAGGTPEEFAELIKTDSAKWAEVVRRSGARLD